MVDGSSGNAVAFADKLSALAFEEGVRVYVDNSNESVGKKIRNAELAKVPYTIVLGEQEMTSGKVTPRVRKDLVVNEPHDPREIEAFLKTIAHEAKSRVSKTSL